MKATPVTIELSLALTTLKAGTVTRVIVPEGEFKTPGGSICTIDESRISPLYCRSPLRQPALMLVGAGLMATCGEAAARVPSEPAPAVAWIGSLETDPAEFGITPVLETMGYFESTGALGVPGRGHICPGSPLAFVAYTPVERVQVKVTTRAVGLQHLTTKQSM